MYYQLSLLENKFISYMLKSEMFSVGKAVEEEAFGIVDQRKEALAVRPYVEEHVLDDLCQRFRKGSTLPSKDVMRRFIKEHEDLKKEFEENVTKLMMREAIENTFVVLTKDQAFEVVKKCQPSSYPGFADDLYYTVGTGLGLEEVDEEENFVDLKFYTAVRSRYDKFGTDGFFIYSSINEETGEKEELIYSMDLTTKTLKEKSSADLVIYLYEDTTEKRSNWEKIVADYGKQIINDIQKRIS